ncbi:hypothetical protein ACLI09_07435 [Flavobacterium sp. RHBU_24]|uniref:hypothetical protein n=1 Tax=Flavobacterium sp. RHBU_24 TaxID=3391185 RepID=UPI0039847EEA
MSENHIFSRLMSGTYIFKNENFAGDIKITPSHIKLHKNIRFDNCSFSNNLLFKNIELPINITFVDCSFYDGLEIIECKIQNLKFKDQKKIKDVIIMSSEFQSIIFNTDHNLEGDFAIRQTVVHFEINFSKIKYLKSLRLEINFNLEVIPNRLTTLLNHSNFKNLHIHGQVGGCLLDRTIIDETLKFDNVYSRGLNLNKALLKGKAVFKNCNFGSIFRFTNVNAIECNVSFELCTFEKHTFFSGTYANNFEIKDVSFEARASFDSLKVVNIDFYLVTFQKIAFFDNLNISNVVGCNRRTLRTIKQELQKAENRIDYNRFRAYELQAFYRELKWNKNFKDWFILGATRVVTGFDHSWTRAFWFTIGSGILCYSTLYFTQFHGSYDFSELNNFFTGAFRFFLITDFSSPFEEKGTYLTNAWLWIPLILGKIVIAFGIYEMIQAFRKFKA